MNFKTTIVLIVLLVAGGLAIFFTRDRGQSGDHAAPSPQKLIDVASSDVNKITITPSDAKPIVMEKTGANWRLTEPVNAAAESFEVDSLVHALTDLQTTSTVSANASSTGLDKPHYTIDLATAGGKSYTILVGDKTAVGDSVYVSRKDKNDVEVAAADLLDHLSKPASTYRDPKLVDLPSEKVNSVTITRPGGKIVLVKSGQDWKITEPTAMPAEKSDVDDIIFGLTGLRATEFVSENTKDAKAYDLSPARYTAVLSAAPAKLPVGVAATTAPAATSQPVSVTIDIGRYDDVLKKNVYVTTSQVPVIAKVGATIIDTINKSPIDLRDRRAMDIDPAEVSAVSIESNLRATTMPTSRPASHAVITISRRHENPTLGPTLAATEAATNPTSKATSKPTTKPTTQPLSTWELPGAKPADDSRVDELLSQLHPLRVEKYLPVTATSRPDATYIITITVQPKGAPAVQHVLRLFDPGNSMPLIGTYNGLTFEADRSLIERVSGDFAKGSQPAHEAAPETPRPSFAP